LYAADDVLYLLDFKKAIESEARNRRLEEWIAQENAIFDELDYSDEDHKNLLKDKDKEDMSIFEWHVYSRLMKFFDEVAERFDKPIYHLISKKQVRKLAQQPAKIDDWNSTKGIFGKLKNDEFKQRLNQILKSGLAAAEDQSLSKNKKASNSMSRDEYQAMRNRQRETNEIKRSLFNPIQQKIEQEFGKHAKSFILPNRLAKEIINGEAEFLPAYKVQLFNKYADELGLNLSDYLS
jgi:ribonuclease D